MPTTFRRSKLGLPTVIHPGDFVIYLCKAERRPEEQVVMARIALNALFDPDLYPVDLLEMMLMSDANRIMSEAFLAYCSINPGQYSNWSDFHCDRLFALCADGRKERSEQAHKDRVESGDLRRFIWRKSECA